MNTPYTEGRLAGYRNAPSDNPYRRGLPMLWTTEQVMWAQAWDDGYAFGQHQAHDDVIERRIEACR